MGVKDLWTIIGPSAEPATVNDLRGKLVAIDLSVWVCENSTGAWTQTQRVKNPHLRNLFFRAWFLLSHGVTPVFVMEGDAPALKAKVMAARNEKRGLNGGSGAGESGGSEAAPSRRQFGGVLRKCKTMLEMMGIVCVTGEGEAESLCARLDADGVVDGCFTQDSDAFLYGARKVYRNFKVTKSRTGGGATFDVFDMNRIETVIGLNRESMVASALLLGCDYDAKGVARVGREKVMKLLTEVWKGEGKKPLERLRQWRVESEDYQASLPKETGPSVSGKCSRCGHKGRTDIHSRKGCNLCGTTSGCVEVVKPSISSSSVSPVEVYVREKAVVVPDFPNEDIIKEFSDPDKNRRHGLSAGVIRRRCCAPDLGKLIPFLVKELNWHPDYCLEKCFQLLTLWVCNNGVSEAEKQVFPLPKEILKKCVKEGINCYEVLWEPPPVLKSLVPDGSPPFEWITNEVRSDFGVRFPDLEAAYLKSKEKPPKAKKAPKEPKAKAVDGAKAQRGQKKPDAAPVASKNIREMFEALSLKETTKDQPVSAARPDDENEKYPIGPAVPSRPPVEDYQRSEEVEECIDISSDSSFDDYVSDSELSVLVDEIVGGTSASSKTPRPVKTTEKVDAADEDAVKEKVRKKWDLKEFLDNQSPTTPSTFCDLDKTRDGSNLAMASPVLKSSIVVTDARKGTADEASDDEKENSFDLDWDERPLAERLGFSMNR